MSLKGSLLRGDKWAHYISLGGAIAEEVKEAMKKNPAMQADYDIYLASIKPTSTPKKA